jgi:hypothetical protein
MYVVWKALIFTLTVSVLIWAYQQPEPVTTEELRLKAESTQIHVYAIIASFAQSTIAIFLGRSIRKVFIKRKSKVITFDFEQQQKGV